ncbi:DNA mismatch repair protein MLH3 isoform X2 [Pyrus x bretschneideri]|uniref:DNA mismatch repair protein MLH3 isoform X2 n=1 Tax=Pyrus x bretschneideri TaxID=225117 RepID=UPI00202EF2A9|nr:DNA mismatch repair protein MLH3 isoform X2 [Pyrus x bretschneideri]
MRSLKPLPEAVSSSVRSGVVLYDLTSVVEELIFNSLDAGATKVSVFVGVGTCYVKVVDDGRGITRDGLVLVGERYATSKFDHSTKTDGGTGSFGFRGEALASISDVSLLEILTKAYGRANGYRKVMKGCKCLYLGIDDDRKDVGTTVVVHDLFYNQPVRRKYMQSSPKKVLDSVNKCVHRIALVHSDVSFKVVDLESENELLRTIPSSSPLTLLKRTFGTVVADTLHELNISDGKLQLSGYISSPCNNLANKAFQYIYINLRFVCKGPIHKLLNQLANTFEIWDPGKAIDGSQNRKRSRPQAFAAYVLNLSCPRIFYDLTFEPSKTYVEFKDWAPVLAFIDKAIQKFWKEKMPDGESGCHGADIFVEDQMRKKGGNIKSTDENLLDGDLSELSKFGKKKSRQNFQASPNIMDVLIQEENRTSQKKHVRMPFEYNEDFNGFQGQHIGIEFSPHTDYSLQSRDDCLDKCKLTTRQKENHPWMSDIKHFSDEDYILENRSAAAERSSNVEDNIFSSEWKDEPFKVDPSVGIGSASSRVSYDQHEFDSDVEFTQNLIQPFLKSCSSKESFLYERDLCADNGIRYQSDGFRNKRRRGGSYNSVEIPEIDSSKSFDFLWPEEESSARPLTKVLTKFDLSTEFDSPSRAFIKSLPHYGEQFYEESSVMNVENIGSCHRTLNNDWCSLISNSVSQNTYLDHEPVSDINAVEGHYRSVKRSTNRHFVDSEEKDRAFGYGIISRRSSREHCTTHTDHELDFSDYSSSGKFFQPHNLDGEFSPECPDILADETGWSSLYARGKDNMDIELYKTQKDQFRDQDCLQNQSSIGRSKRSHSAPPFYRSKRRYSTLSHPLTTIAGKPDAQTFHDAPTYPVSKMKDLHKPPGGCHLNLNPSSLKDFPLAIRSDTEKSQNRMAGVNKTHKVEMFEQSKCSAIQATAPIKEFISKDQNSLNCGTKWRNCCPQITSSSKTQGLDDQNILDISSGFLHLSSDSLVPESINKNCLSDCRVLRQVDKKYIAVTAGTTLAVIDQHAADERIRLEELRQKVLCGEGEAKAITFLDVEQELVLPEIGYQLLHNYAKPVEEWGWLCNTHAEGSGSFKRNLNLLHRQPTAITLTAVPCILGVNLSDLDLMEFLQQLADTDGSSTTPPSVLRILNSKACRGAIMFGDSLLPSECNLIVEELKQTSLCFQCAHGRPTTAPLVNLEALHKQIAKITSSNDGTDQLWHGLGRHELSLARAEKRLNLARS